MGEIADMMINGLMCQYCGEFMDDFGEPGYPRSCGCCDDGEDYGAPIQCREPKNKRATKKAMERSILDRVHCYLEAGHPLDDKRWTRLKRDIQALKEMKK